MSAVDLDRRSLKLGISNFGIKFLKSVLSKEIFGSDFGALIGSMAGFGSGGTTSYLICFGGGGTTSYLIGYEAVHESRTGFGDTLGSGLATIGSGFVTGLIIGFVSRTDKGFVSRTGIGFVSRTGIDSGFDTGLTTGFGSRFFFSSLSPYLLKKFYFLASSLYSLVSGSIQFFDHQYLHFITPLVGLDLVDDVFGEVFDYSLEKSYFDVIGLY